MEMIQVFGTLFATMFVYDVFKFSLKVAIGAAVIHSRKEKI